MTAKIYIYLPFFPLHAFCVCLCFFFLGSPVYSSFVRTYATLMMCTGCNAYSVLILKERKNIRIIWYKCDWRKCWHGLWNVLFRIVRKTHFRDIRLFNGTLQYNGWRLTLSRWFVLCLEEKKITSHRIHQILYKYSKKKRSPYPYWKCDFVIKASQNWK